MRKKIDLYIIKKFLGTFFFILALLMAISVIFDISEKIDDFIESDAPLSKIIFQYYVNFIVYYSNLFASLLIFIAVILFTSRMSQLTEIVAILSAGVSFNRMLRPFMVSATILASISLIFNHFVVPFSNKTLNNFKYTYLDTRDNYQVHNLHREIEKGTIVFVESVAPSERIAFKFSMEKWKAGKLTYKLISDRAVYDSVNNKWTLHNYYERYMGKGNDKLNKGFMKDTTLKVTLGDFALDVSSIVEMNSIELMKYIDKERQKGSDRVPFYEVELHQRTSLPMATYILTLMAVSIASRKARGGIGLHIASGITIALLYIFFMKVTVVGATHAGLNPILAVWLPNIVFGLAAFLVYRKAPK